MECCNCGMADKNGKYIRGDWYCRSCAAHEVEQDENDDNPFERDYSQCCIKCGSKYQLDDPKTFGIINNHVVCINCARK